MKKTHQLTLACSVMAFAAGAILVSALNLAPAEEPAMHGMHHHELYEIPADLPVPSLELNLYKDPKSGYTLQLVTENFAFVPEEASTDNSDGNGHAHLYINDEKITRLYGEWVYLPPEWFDAEEAEVHVTLNTNDHKDYAVNGVSIEASVMLSEAAEF